jgi:hypothetical protein
MAHKHEISDTLCSVPANWTDTVALDPYWRVGRRRSRFRLEDLLLLADLIDAGRER